VYRNGGVDRGRDPGYSSATRYPPRPHRDRRGSRPRAARRRPPPGASWQRCRTHYAANLMSSTPEVELAVGAGAAARSTTALGLRPARRGERARPVRPDPRRRGREAARRGAHLDTARGDVLASTTFPKELWRQVWSNNPQVIWSRSTGVRDVVDEAVRSRVLPGGRGYLPRSSTRRPGRFDVRCSGGVARSAA
jgi:putative transposase